jgi:hypothetical protein
MPAHCANDEGNSLVLAEVLLARKESDAAW